jgi:hypothetical protein
MKEENFESLSRLREKITLGPVNELMRILLEYYPKGTKLIITKDYWNIVDNDEMS